MYQSFKRILTAFAVLLVGISAFAQVTTSSLNGKVTDRSGEPVVGAAVIAVHTPSGTQYYAVANADGRFTINGMRSGGPYSVEISCLGYQTVTYTDVTLQLAEAYSLDAEMPDDTEMLSEAIVISTAYSRFAAV
ncbi:MAG: carboxypeptidase regulatory-like domain-containing protein, partial [Bacteroidales bacterium]|nr:carboxypeptidase regulatory-like domain-containing protein [Bacteroidales bacterium]